MGLRDFLCKQFIDVIQWTEPEDGILAYRYPMRDMEIQNGAQAHGPRVADGGVRQRGPNRRHIRARTLHAQHADAAPADQPDELGQGVQVPVQKRRLFLLDAYCRPISDGARRSRSRFATRNSARSGCARSVFTPRTSPTRDLSHEGQRHAGIVSRGRPRRPTAEHDRRRA